MANEREVTLQKHVEALLQHRPRAAADGAAAAEGLELPAAAASAPPLSGRAIAAADERELELALRGLEKVERGSPPSAEESFAVEAIILPAERPIFDIRDDTFTADDPLWAHYGEQPIREVLEGVIPSIGRIEIPGHPSIPFAGTGFVVGEGLLMTNRHVAELFTRGLGLRDLSFIPGHEPAVDMRQEVASFRRPELLSVEQVLFIHPFWDCALLQVDGLGHRTQLSLASSEPTGVGDREVAIIGYPALDPRNRIDLQRRMFRNTFNRKRLQPGKATGYRDIRSFRNTVEALTHDASTLGGNSGSAVVDVATGEVLALHFAGLYLDANFAVPSWQLALDSRVRDAGVRFGAGSPPTQPTAWEAHWIQADPPSADEPIDPSSSGDSTSTSTGGASIPPKGALSTSEALPDLEWYESLTDHQLFEALRRDEVGTRRRLRRFLGVERAQKVIDDLETAVGGVQTPEEFLFSPPEPDPDLPEIVYLHGIMGGHLANDYGAGSRLWLSALAFLGGNVAERLSLADDGESDRRPGLRVGADGHIGLKYARAARRWRGRRFAVHCFSYDWRKPVEASADRLHAFIEGLAAGNSRRRFALVAHSMGGLVAASYALRNPRWQDRVERAVLVGSPLGGSFSPVEALLGSHPTFQALARISRHDSADDFGRLAQSLPGLLAMLPNPDLFPTPRPIHVGDTWDHGFRPLQRWLTYALNFKRDLLNSPLLPRATGIVSGIHPTLASAVLDDQGKLRSGPRTGLGDGTVPLRAAAVEPLGELYESRGKRHGDLMLDAKVIEAVGDLLAHGTTDALKPLPFDSINFDVALPEAPLEVAFDAVGLETLEATGQLEGLRRRVVAEDLRAADVDWILDPLGSPPPQ